MTPPPGLTGAALLFWGWHTGLLPAALAMGLLLEAAHLVPWRWELSRGDLYRVADLCRLVLLAMGTYLFSTRSAAAAVWGIVQWYPMAVLPLAACQAYGAAATLDLWTFLLVIRRRVPADGDPHHAPINLGYPYVALCIVSASAANGRTSAFYIALCGLAAWALWAVRVRRVPVVVWGGLLLVAALLGYGGHVALHGAQRMLVGTLMRWVFADMLHVDPYRASTAIGDIGDLKLSERIVLRVDPGEDVRPPVLLREASYSIYDGKTWFAPALPFHSVRPGPDTTTWALARGPTPHRAMTISGYLRRGTGVLALPHGAAQLERLRVVRVERNGLGAVKVEEGVGLVTYRARFDPDTSLDAEPVAADLRLPPEEVSTVARLVAELGLGGLTPQQRVDRLAAFFREHFRYSTFLGRREPGRTALESFLVRSRRGHCEYFATATVLLLRAAGIPARYAVGYSVQEWSELERRFVARARHAHAWALAYVDGAWRSVDTTPPAWFAIEATAASAWEPLYDLLAWGFFLFSEWRWSEEEGRALWYLGGLLIPLIGFLAWRLRLVRRRAPSPVSSVSPSGPAPARLGEDSDFFRLERRLGELGLPRQQGEPLSSWIRRLEAASPAGVSLESLSGMLTLHYRYRFDPVGISRAERDRLRDGVVAWLDRHDGASEPCLAADGRGAPRAAWPPGLSKRAPTDSGRIRGVGRPDTLGGA